MKIPPVVMYVLIPPAAIAGAVLLWLGACELLSWVGGWRSLAAHYEAMSPPGGEDLGPCTVMMSGGPMLVTYRGSVRIHIAPGGLGLQAGRFWRRGHPPLLIPWSSIEKVEGERQLVGEAVAVTVRDSGRTLIIRGAPGRRVRERWEEAAAAR